MPSAFITGQQRRREMGKIETKKEKKKWVAPKLEEKKTKQAFLACAKDVVYVPGPEEIECDSSCQPGLNS